jgi:iron complex outermembrane receptor protein
MRTKSRILFMFFCLMASSVLLFAQEKKTVTGTVKDNTGAVLSNATVTEKGTKNSVVTNATGTFSISVLPNATLQITYAGMSMREVAVAGQTNLDIAMTDAGQLTEVVVTSLGISKQQKALGYATATVKSEDIVRTAPPNFAQALYGKAPGVRVASAPGGATSGVSINIRGINSITGKNQPLIVLDGVPIRNGEFNNTDYWSDQRVRGNGLLDINPEDIENLSILKGASAAALYGSEAVNGVVLITTKKGGKGQKGFSVDVNASYSVDKVAYQPKYQNVRGYGISKVDVPTLGQDEDRFIWVDLDGDGTKETRSVPNASINFGGVFDGKPTLGWDGVIRPYSSQGDNLDAMFQDAQNSNINVALTQVSENNNIRFSLTRQENEGVSLNSKNTKNIANFNSTFRLAKKYSMDLQVNYVNQITKNRPYSIDRLTNNFTGMIGRFDNAEWYANKYQTSQGYRFVTGTGQSLTPEENINGGYGGFKGDIADYFWRVNKHMTEEKSNRVIASMTHHWQILPSVKLRGRLANDFTTQLTENSQATERPLIFGNSGGFGMQSYNYNIIYGDLLATWTKRLTDDLELNVMGGYTAQQEEGTEISRSTNGGLSTENRFDVGASVNTPNSSSRRQSITKDAFLGTVNVSYKGWLFVEGTVRRDRTSTMNPNNNAFVYPSINSSFIISQAFKMPEFIDYLKVRGSWGIVGNYPDPYLANVAYNQNTLGSQGANPVLYTNIPMSYGNDLIRPEQKNEFEFGLDSRLFDNRLGIDLSYYNAKVVDQILPLSLPITSGASSILSNVGTLRNTGIELGLNYNAFRQKNFRWDITLNLAQNMNKVEALAPGLTELLHADYDGNAAQLKSVVGQPMGDFYAHPVLKDKTGQPIVDPNGLYKVDANSMYKVGNAMPKVTGGLINSFTFHRVTLDAVIDFRFGGHVMPTAIYWMMSRGLLEETLQGMDKAHGGLTYYVDATGKKIQTSGTTGPNGEKVYDNGMLLPGVKADGTASDYMTTSDNYWWTVYNWGGPQYSPNTRYELYIQKNSYIKMRELALGYNLPTDWAKKIGAKSVNLSIFGRNLFYFYRTLKHIDAEQTAAGARWFQSLTNVGTNPSTRTVGVMLRTSF